MSTQREIPALPDMNGMSIPVARQRNRRLCEWICEYPPTVAAVSQTTLAFSSKTTKGVGYGDGSGGGGGGNAVFDETTIDLLIAKKIKNKILFTNRIEAYEIITTRSSGYTVDCDEDVIFNGKCETNDKWFWNGSTSTMYVDGYVEIKSSCITINGSRTLTEDDANRTIGIKFNYWNTETDQEEIGWFGFDPTTKCFRYLLNVNTCPDSDLEHCNCQVENGIPGDICTDNFIALNLRNKSLENEDLNIISDQSINTTATEGINLDSATYTLETTTGTIISNTGTEGIEILSSDGNIDIISTNSEMNLQTIEDNMNINVDTGNMEICVDDGELNICVSSTNLNDDLNLTSYGQSQINLISNKNNEQAILIEASQGGIDINAMGQPGEDINIYNTASVHTVADEAVDDAICFTATNGGICLEANTQIDITAPDINVNADNILITVTDDFILNGAEKEDYRTWIPYKTFDVSCGYWQSFRDQISGSPIYYWRKVARNETVYLNVDLVNPFRTDTNKGFKLDKIFFSYEIENTPITSFTPIITLKTWDNNNPSSAVSLTQINYIDGNLLTNGLSVDEHYRYIDITSPSYLNSESVINIEVELVTPANSIFKFYGMMIHYTMDIL